MSELAVNSVWVGASLGPVHAACLRSYLRAGHRVVLHCYSPPDDLPDGVELADADELIPQSQVFRHRKSGSYSTFSNLLRYRILARGLGLYADCDVFCLRPIADADYIFAWQSDDLINGAVLKLPPDCPALRDLNAIGEDFIPPWLSERERRRLRVRRMLGRARGLGALPWGSVGPRAVTWYIRQHGLEPAGSPIDRFYPVAHTHVSQLLDPELSLEELVTRRTDAVHLWNEVLRYMAPTEIPPTSPLHRMIAM